MSDHQYYQAPPPYQPPPKKGWIARHKILTAAGGILLFVVIMSVATGGGEDSDGGAAAPEQSQAAPAELPTEVIEAPAEEAPTKAPAKKASPSYPDGDYAVGEDIPSGTYTSAGATAGLFEFCSITTTPTDPSTMPQLKSANADQRIIITLSKADGVVSISGCEPLKPRA